MAEEFFKDMYDKKSRKKAKSEALLDKLYQKPPLEKGINMPHFAILKPNYVNQADLLMLPDDKGYKYLLVVVDDYDRKTDAEPLKEKTPAAILEAFKTIYEKRKILKLPKTKIEVDGGTEFKGVVQKWFEDKKIMVRVAQPGRHRQQALVERKNQEIGKALNKKMAAQEMLTGETSREWKDDVKKLVNVMNKHLPKVKIDENNNKRWENQELLMLGTKVRAALDQPVDSTRGTRLHGRFRTGDLRFDPKVRTINQVLLKPTAPIMYLLDGPNGPFKTDNVARTREQLQLVSDKETYPNPKILPKDAKQFIVKDIVDEKVQRKKKYLLVSWQGFTDKDNTWEPYDHMKKENPKLIEDYERSKNKRKPNIKK